MAGVEGNAPGIIPTFEDALRLEYRARISCLGGLGIFQREVRSGWKRKVRRRTWQRAAHGSKDTSCETLEQMPWRGRAIGHGEKGKGDRPVHIKFMTLGPRFLEGARQEALNPGRKEKKDGDGQCEKRPWQGGSPSPVSRLQRAGWHFNGLVFDWLAALKHWRATPARSDELLATSKECL